MIQTCSLAKTMGQSGSVLSVRSIDSYTLSKKGYSLTIVLWTRRSFLRVISPLTVPAAGLEVRVVLSLLCSFPISFCAVVACWLRCVVCVCGCVESGRKNNAASLLSLRPPSFPSLLDPKPDLHCPSQAGLHEPNPLDSKAHAASKSQSRDFKDGRH